MTERSESERAELVARIERAFQRNVNCVITPIEARGYLTALRSLAAQDQKPVAYLHSHPKGIDNLTRYQLTDADKEYGWVEKPLYSDPPPAAGWGEAIEACKKVAEKWLESFMGGEVYVARSIVNAIEALRQSAPPDSGAGKSGDAGARISNLAADLVVSGWMASNAHDVERRKKEAEQKLLDFACDEIERHIKRDPSVMPDHGGADAGVRVKPLEWLSEEKPFFAGTRFCTYRISQVDDDTWETAVSYRGPRCWHHQTEAEAKAAAQADYERRILSALSHHHAPVAANASAEARLREALTGLQRQSNAAYCRYIDQMSKPECLGFEAKFLSGKFSKIELDAHARAGEMIGAHRALSDAVKQINEALSAHPHASAEARLREALRDLVALVSTDSRYDDSESLRSARNILFAENKAAMAALSAHPHASDCDKQGPVPSGYGEYTPITVGGSTSDRTADVTVGLRRGAKMLCGDCPPVGHETTRTRCVTCPFTAGRWGCL